MAAACSKKPARSPGRAGEAGRRQSEHSCDCNDRRGAWQAASFLAGAGRFGGIGRRNRPCAIDELGLGDGGAPLASSLALAWPGLGGSREGGGAGICPVAAVAKRARNCVSTRLLVGSWGWLRCCLPTGRYLALALRIEACRLEGRGARQGLGVLRAADEGLFLFAPVL